MTDAERLAAAERKLAVLDRIIAAQNSYTNDLAGKLKDLARYEGFHQISDGTRQAMIVNMETMMSLKAELRHGKR